jgi:hypothetical protein
MAFQAFQVIQRMATLFWEEQGTTSQEPWQRVSQWWVVPLLRILSLHFVSEKLYSLRHKKNDVLGFKIYQKECHFT